MLPLELIWKIYYVCCLQVDQLNSVLGLLYHSFAISRSLTVTPPSIYPYINQFVVGIVKL